MNDHLKDVLGTEYRYCRWLDAAGIEALKKDTGGPFWCTVATLTAGCVRLDAVLFVEKGEHWLGYDVLVRESLSSPDWVCYDSLSDTDSLEEERMLAVLEQVVKTNGLSYTVPDFRRLVGKKQAPESKRENGKEKA